ncbi:DUF669 domain-containing protein [Romboutsia sp. 1001285H_161024_C4]|uniref:DUF669 domain-containing protein n=1 Tax=Romboutsia sp. 1001285H_161024_C4 TaxID=2787109 RepID=UPI00189BC90F|nr:DUF669 domain-containing protein [Romboutsia sp. 1001285H_161024_C4]
MADIWDKFDNTVDVEGLKKDLKDAEENGGGNYKEVPVGTYEVEVDKLELKETKKGDPMLSCWMKVLEGEFKGSIIFYNQVLTTGYGIHNANEFLRSLDSGVEVDFENFKQYNSVLLDVYEAINGKLAYALEYGKNNKDFNTYKIVDVFEE